MNKSKKIVKLMAILSNHFGFIFCLLLRLSASCSFKKILLVQRIGYSIKTRESSFVASE